MKMKMTVIIKVKSENIKEKSENIKVKSENIKTYLIEDVIFVNYVDGKLILVDKSGNIYKYVKGAYDNEKTTR